MLWVQLVAGYSRDGEAHAPGALVRLEDAEARRLIEDGAAIPATYSSFARETR